MMRLKAIAKGKRVKTASTGKDQQAEILKRLAPQQVAALIRVLVVRTDSQAASDR